MERLANLRVKIREQQADPKISHSHSFGPSLFLDKVLAGSAYPLIAVGEHSPVTDAVNFNASPKTTVVLQSDDAPRAMLAIRCAVEKEIARLEQGRDFALTRLQQFEAQYSISSARFAEEMTAEDVAGGDLEYVEWVGEYRLFQQLVEDLALLKSLSYVSG